MKSKFALSFGISVILIGIINLFLETNNTIIFGISVSALVFSIISILFSLVIDEEKYEFLNIIPLLIMFTFICYGNKLMEIDIMNRIVNSRLTTAITFISFGLSFVGEYIVERKMRITERIKHLALATEMLEYTCLLINIENNYFKECLRKKTIIDEAGKSFLNELEELFKEKEKESHLICELLSTEKDNYSIDDFRKIYVKNNDILNVNIPIKGNKSNRKKKKQLK